MTLLNPEYAGRNGPQTGGRAFLPAVRRSRFVAFLPAAVALAAALAGPASWLAAAVPAEGWHFSNDDAWIHQVFARNLARDGVFAFNPGERSVGDTAPAWALLLGALHLCRLPVVPATLALGVAAFALWVMGLFYLIRTAWPEGGEWWAAAAAVIFAALGPPVWYALSGLETPLFFGLGTWAVVAYFRRRDGVAGFAAAAATALRPEGGILVAAFFLMRLVTLVRDRRRPTAGEWFGYVACPLLFVVPFLVQNVAVAGTPMPSTFAGRRWFYGGEGGSAGPIAWDGPLVMAFYWREFVDYFVFSLEPVASFVSVAASPFLLSQLGFWAMVAAAARRRLPGPFFVFVVWVLLHNLAYAFFLTNFGSAARYQGINLAFFAVVAVFGARLLWDWVKAPGFRFVTVGLLAACFVAACGSNRAWYGLYADNVYHLSHVHETAGKWVDKNLPAGARVAAFDIGAFGYYSDRYIVDIGGLIDPRAAGYLRHRVVNEYLRQKNADYVQVMEYETPDAKSIGARTGLYHYNRHDYDLSYVNSWELPADRAIYIAVTGVAYPKMTLYRINWRRR